MHPRVNVCAIIYVIDIYQIIHFSNESAHKKRNYEIYDAFEAFMLINGNQWQWKTWSARKDNSWEMNYY